MNILNLKSPDIFNPVPSLQEQTHKALNLPDPASIGPQDDIQPGDTTPDPTNIDYLMRSKNYNTAIEAILDSAKPQPDPEKEKRLKQRAAIGAIGDAFRQVFSGVNMAKGYNVKPENMNTAPTDALTNYMNNEEAKRLQWNNQLAQAKIHGLNYSEQMKDAADQMRYNIWKTKQDNALKANDQAFDRWYKTTSLDQNNKQFLAKMIMDKELKLADIQQRKNESDQDYKARMAMVAASRYNATLDYNASIDKNKNKGAITFINPQSGIPDRISEASAMALVQAEKERIEQQYEKDDKHYKIAQDASTPGTTYNLIVRYLSGGGMTAKELETLMRTVYSSENILKTKQFSENDLGAGYRRKYGKSETTTENQNNTSQDPDPTKYDGHEGVNY